MIKYLLIFLIFPVLIIADTEQLEVESLGSPDQWSVTSGSTKLTAVNGDNGDNKYIYEASTDQEQRYLLYDPVSVTAEHTIDSVLLYIRPWEVSDNCNMQAKFYLSTNYTNWNLSMTGSPATQSNKLARPGGGDWTLTDLNNLQINLDASDLGLGGTIRCSRLYALVYYSSASAGQVIMVN